MCPGCMAPFLLPLSVSQRSRHDIYTGLELFFSKSWVRYLEQVCGLLMTQGEKLAPYYFDIAAHIECNCRIPCALAFHSKRFFRGSEKG